MSKASLLVWIRWLLAALCVALAPHAMAQQERNRIAVEAVTDGAPVPGRDWLIALHFTPIGPEWHGYWSHPGDAGLGMETDWTLPQGWTAGDALYPLPKTLMIAGLMNHVYEGDYAVLVPIRVPGGAAVQNVQPVTLALRYLACTDQICVPQQARLTIDPARTGRDPRFAQWRAAVVPPLGSTARFAITASHLRVAIPLPASAPLGKPHLFVAANQVGGAQQIAHGGAQIFKRAGDLLVAEVPLKTLPQAPGAPVAGLGRPGSIEGIIAFGTGRGARFSAVPGTVPLASAAPLGAMRVHAFWQLALAALIGGLILNVMPCVFPILSLKALTLAKAGGDARAARADARAYTAGVVLACTALGGLILVLRAGGEQIGWAFQLQDPLVVAGLLLLALAITANFAGVFDLPGLAVSGGQPGRTSSFATGLLAAFVATPCTGPFMALALGAALVLPPLEGVAIFALLGVGLAAPFLALGYVPALRRLLPRPGAWMERFRRWMALPMGLTAVALAWLLWRAGGTAFMIAALGLSVGVVALLWLAGRKSRVWFVVPLAAAMGGLALLPDPAPALARPVQSLLKPEPYSAEALARARATGRPVFVWFTADWCLSCKVNERVAIERESTRAAFAAGKVIALRADWTRADPAISAALAAQGAAGIPLYLWYAPGQEAEQLPQVLTPQMLAAKAQPGPGR